VNTTEAKLMQLEAEVARLRAENAKLSSFYHHASDAFIVLDEQRTIVAMNDAARRLTGFEHGEGLHCGDLFRCHDEQGNQLRDTLCFGRCTLELEASTPYVEMMLKHRDGHPYSVSVSYSFIPSETGRPHLLMVLRDLTVKKRLEQEQLAKNELEITLKERERLSRDLHDGLVQCLAFLGLKAKLAINQMESTSYERVKDSLNEMADVLNESYSEVRQALYDLRTPITADLASYLDEYLQNFTLQTRIETELHTDEQFPSCHNARTSIHVLKVVQEALTNVRKHSAATRVSVQLTREGETVRIAICDNGRGFEVGQPSDDGLVHYGLTTMEERMQLIGGHINVRSQMGAGTEVVLVLPCSLFHA